MLNKRGVKINEGGREVEIFVKVNKRGDQKKWGVCVGEGGVSKYPLVSIINEKRDINV